LKNSPVINTDSVIEYEESYTAPEISQGFDKSPSGSCIENWQTGSVNIYL